MIAERKRRYPNVGRAGFGVKDGHPKLWEEVLEPKMPPIVWGGRV
jgi:hypothetical protein